MLVWGNALTLDFFQAPEQMREIWLCVRGDGQLSVTSCWQGLGFSEHPASLCLFTHPRGGLGGRSRTGPVYSRMWLRFLAVPLTCLLSSTIFSSRVMCGQEPPCERCLCSAEGQQPPAPVPSSDTHVQRSSLGTVAMVTDLVTANSTN